MYKFLVSLIILVGVVLTGCQGNLPVVDSGQVFFYRNPDFVQPNLGVSTTDFQLYDANNPDHLAAVMARYTKVFMEGEQFNQLTSLPIQRQPYTVIGPNQLGQIDNYVLPPGNYFRIPIGDVTIVNAAMVSDTDYGILYTPSLESYSLLEPGVHRALEQFVRYFPSAPQRYRLISSALMDRTTRGEIDACQSALCETTLSDVMTSDPSVRVSVDLEVNFGLCFENQCLVQLYQLHDPQTLMRTYISGPIRTSGRSIWGDISPAEMQTRAGWIRMEELLLEMLNTELEDAPIQIFSVGIRGVELPEEYLAQQSQGASEEQALQAEMRNASLAQSATATAGAFLRQQQQLETEHTAQQMQILRNVVGSDDPIVVCALINIFYEGACTYPLPVEVNIDQVPQS